MKILHIGACINDPESSDSGNVLNWLRMSCFSSKYLVVARSTLCRFTFKSFSKELKVFYLPSFFHREIEYTFTHILSLPLILFFRPNIVILQSPVHFFPIPFLCNLLFQTKIISEIHGHEYFSNSNTFKHKVLRYLAYFGLRFSHRVRVLSNLYRLTCYVFTAMISMIALLFYLFV